MALRRPDDRASPLEHPSETPTVKVGLRRDDPTKRMKVRSDQDTERMPAYPGTEAPEAREQAPIEPVHERLLNAARERFSTDGYENATTASIARQAGTSESQLVKHFGSKEGLLESIFDEAWSRLSSQARTAMEEHPAPLGRLLSVADTITRAVERDRKLRSLLLLEARRIRKNGYDVVISTGFRHFIGLVDGLFADMERQGDLAAEVHLEAARSAWLGALEGLLRDQMLGELMGYPATFNRKVLRKTALSVLGAFLTPRAQRMLHALAD
jgi:AcrR family transcriptional regulator